MNNRKKKHRIYAMFRMYHESRNWLTDEVYAWEFMLPVGREFGSPDYERLAKLDAVAYAVTAVADHASESTHEPERFVQKSNQTIKSMESTHQIARKSDDEWRSESGLSDE